jgi:limonene-1,2-epoxide hydrolase
MQSAHVSSRTTGPERDIAIVESFLAAFARGDLEGALAHLSDDIVYQNVPFAPDRGKPAVSRTLRAFGSIATSFRVEMYNIAARGGVVLSERGDIIKGPLLDLDLHVCGTFEIQDGKIVLWRDSFDLASTAVKLLVSPLRWLLSRSRASVRRRLDRRDRPVLAEAEPATVFPR